MGRQAKSATGAEHASKLLVGYFKTAQQTNVLSANFTHVERNYKATVGNFGNIYYFKKRFLNQRSKFKNEKSLTSTTIKNCQLSRFLFSLVLLLGPFGCNKEMHSQVNKVSRGFQLP